MRLGRRSVYMEKGCGSVLPTERFFFASACAWPREPRSAQRAAARLAPSLTRARARDGVTRLAAHGHTGAPAVPGAGARTCSKRFCI